MSIARFSELARKAVRRSWMRYALKGVGDNDNYQRLDLAYRMPDPWNMTSAMEQARFSATNLILEREFGKVGSLLELGCGEGHQSEYFLRLAGMVYGVDVSAQAIARAKIRLPAARFSVGDVHTQPFGVDGRRFDIVTACEVLYYIKDLDATLDRMSQLGRSCLVTFFAPAVRRVAKNVLLRPGVQRDWFYYGATTWLACWWRNE